MAKKRGQSAAFMRSINPHFRKKQISHSTKRGANKMARKRKGFKKYAKAAAKPMAILLGGGLYGAGRAKISNALTPFTSKIPLGTIADEAVMFGLSYVLHSKVNNKIVKDITLAGMAVEAARIGEAVADGTAFSTSGASVNNNLSMTLD